jgi:hypothetical protein
VQRRRKDGASESHCAPEFAACRYGSASNLGTVKSNKRHNDSQGRMTADILSPIAYRLGTRLETQESEHTGQARRSVSNFQLSKKQEFPAQRAQLRKKEILGDKPGRKLAACKD